MDKSTWAEHAQTFNRHGGIGGLAAEIDALRAETARLRKALEEIADVAHPPDMRSVNIARQALGRG